MGLEIIPAPRMTRPADTTAYAAGDLVANSTTAGSVVPLVFTGGGTPLRLRRARMLSSNSTVTNKNYFLFLFSTSPTVTNGDNGAMAVTAANHGTLLAVLGSTAALSTGGGSVNIFYPLDGAAGAVNGWIPTYITGTCYGLLRANAAYTPSSAETFDVILEATTDGMGE